MAKSARGTRILLSSNSAFERIAGYSRVVADGDWVFSAGTTGFDYARGTIAPALADQVKRTLRNVKSFLACAGVTLEDVVQCNWVITRRQDFAPCARLLKQAFAPNRPVMMTLVCDLIDPRMKFEMQVIARKPRRRPTASRSGTKPARERRSGFRASRNSPNRRGR